MKISKQAILCLSLSSIVLSVLALVGANSCRNVPGDPGKPYPNQPPNTRLANLPVNDSTGQYIHLGRIPEKTLQWVGDDVDGFVIAYRLRWTDSTRSGVITNPWITILNVSNIGDDRLDTLILVQGTPRSLFDIYSFFATFDPLPRAAAERRRIKDSLATGRPFAVPYQTGIVPGDSVVGADPLNFETPTKGTFIFASPGDRNKHKFEVASIDNKNEVDPTPAYTYFWTLQSDTPKVYFTSPLPIAMRYVLRYPTEHNPGLRFAFYAIDPSTSDIVYSYAVDFPRTPGIPDSLLHNTLQWSPWNPVPQALVTARDFRHIDSTRHGLYIRARNRWGVVSPIRDTVFFAKVPPIDDPNWPKRTLIINNNKISGISATDTVDVVPDSAVRAFYSDIMNSLRVDPNIMADGLITGYRFWNVVTGPTTSSFPPIDTLVHYTHVLFLAEQEVPILGPDASRRRLTSGRQEILRTYLNVGGNIIYSGTPYIARLISPSYPWFREVFHADTSARNELVDFVGVGGLEGYPTMRIDSSKVPIGAIKNITLSIPIGFGRPISVFHSATGNPLFHNRPLGIKYHGALIPPARRTFSSVYFGFPLYYAMRDDVFLALRQAYIDIQRGD